MTMLSVLQRPLGDAAMFMFSSVCCSVTLIFECILLFTSICIFRFFVFLVSFDNLTLPGLHSQRCCMYDNRATRGGL